MHSESGGWSNSTPYPETPLPGTGAATGVSGRRPGKYKPPWGVGGGVPPGHTAPRRSGSGSASAATLLLPQLLTPGTPPSYAGAPETLVPSPLSVSRRPHPKSCLAHVMSIIPCQPSLPCSSVFRPNRRARWGCQTPYAASPIGSMSRDHCKHRSMPPGL